MKLENISKEQKIAILPINEAIEKTKEDEKDINKYLREIKNCKEIKVKIIRKNGNKIDVTFVNKYMKQWLDEEIEILINVMKNEVVQLKKELLKMQKEGEKNEQN
ncbi:MULTISPECIES: hypothetical protein [unclassified Clostridioides]|uniref:hypothetical protein n=1 Tax=unclassified Clostridioides TaxID=2635829 RepID=UPI001D0C045B|nr:hypothetical protein [Clostridioides sp. ES-S-0049-03]MCC0678134.1 hypothetical protein [Clostridioides sp. ES-W-0018-02]MCC0712890.1 hypothetical protein [Clostridioides sp. ES-W-0017-02]MCC0764974.1 hypothetical protein [Clostridioides sp. ES-S-0006-03]